MERPEDGELGESEGGELRDGSKLGEEVGGALGKEENMVTVVAG